MDKAAYRDEIKLKLTGDILELELTDETIDRVIDSALREIQRYICSTKYVTVPYTQCIDLNKVTDEFKQPIKVNSVSRIYRANGTIVGDSGTGTSMMDPMQASQWQLISGLGNINNFQNYAYNLESWLSLLQIRNTLSTDLAFRYDKSSNRLYINVSSGAPGSITIEYVPRYDSVEEIVSDYWIDSLIRMAVALTKITVGRVRTRYTQSNALWTQDGAQLLQEGLEEYRALQEYLQANTQLVYGID